MRWLRVLPLFLLGCSRSASLGPVAGTGDAPAKSVAELVRYSDPVVCDEAALTDVMDRINERQVRLDLQLVAGLTVPASEWTQEPYVEVQTRLDDNLLGFGGCRVRVKEAKLQPRIVEPRRIAVTGIHFAGSCSRSTQAIVVSVDDPVLEALSCCMEPERNADAYFLSYGYRSLTVAHLNDLLAGANIGLGDNPLECTVPVADLSVAIHASVVAGDLNTLVAPTPGDVSLPAYRDYRAVSLTTDEQKAAYDCAVLGMKREIDTDADVSRAFTAKSTTYLTRYVASMRGALGDLSRLGCHNLNERQIYDGTRAVISELDAREHDISLRTQ